ncbi:MAG: Sca4 family spreading effector, partial [Rickettsia endosymbiont of Pentastiridius leporinus]
MSKDNNPNVSDLDPVANRTYTDEEKQRLEQEEKEFLNQTPPSQSRARDNILFNDSDTPTSTSSLGALSGNIADNDNGVTDPITEAIRKQILEEQRRLIREHLLAEHKAEPQKNPDLGTYLEDDEKFKEFLRNLNADQSKRDLYDNALKNADLKKQLEATEINGYRNIHSTFSGEKYPGGFKQMSWDGPIQDSTRSQVVKNGVGAEICTLTETTHNTSPITVSHNGKPVTINSYRTIDFPVQLDEKASGTMHLSLVARDKDGNAPSVDKAVYFTAHYEATPPPNGIPKLKEVSSPQPLKFLGEGKEAVGYIEHGGEIYTLPVTRGKYQEMMKEVEINKGQSVDVSQTIAVDQSKTQEQTVTPQQINPAVEKPIETQNIETPKPHQVPPMTPASQPLNPGILQPPQPQKAEFTGIPNPVINAATELSQVMKDLLEQVNKDLKNEVDKAGLIGE